jgi:hypothetical protein
VEDRENIVSPRVIKVRANRNQDAGTLVDNGRWEPDFTVALGRSSRSDGWQLLAHVCRSLQPRDSKWEKA